MDRARLLGAVLSVVAGSCDAVGLLGFGLFTAHITGNLAVLAVHVGSGRPASLALVLSIPVFVVAVAAARWWADRLRRAGRALLLPLLWGQLLLLVGFVGLVGAGEAAGIRGFGERAALDGPHSVVATVAVLLAVAAMAVQNALVLTVLTGAAPTTVMTTNLTRFTMAGSDLVVRSGDPRGRAPARHQLGRTGPVIAGFLVGAALAALAYAWLGWWAMAVPVVLAAVALLMARPVAAASPAG